MDFECHGSHYEMGHIQGTLLKDNITESYRRFFDMDVVKKFIPGDFLASTLGALAYGFLMKRLEEFDKPTFERIKGLSDALGIELNQLLFLQFFESLISSPIITTSACTTAIIDKEKNFYHSPILIKDYDLFTDLDLTTCLRFSNPKNRLHSMELIITPLTGNHLGINEAGLTVCYNYGMVKSFFRKYLPPTIICQYALETFSRTKQVIEFISKVGCANGAIFTIMDETGHGVIAEVLGPKMAVREMEEGFLTASNVFYHPNMTKHNYKDTDKYNDLAPDAYANLFINDSCRKRFDRMDSLLREKRFFGKLSYKDMKRILKDHNGQDAGDDNTVCRHSTVLSTLAGIVVNVRERTMQVAFGNPCQSHYHTYKLK